MARAEIFELKLELLNAVWGAAHKSASLVREGRLTPRRCPGEGH